MPAKRTPDKNANLRRDFYLTVVLAIALGTGLYFLVANFYPEALKGFGGTPSNEPALKCSKESDTQINCNWKNCELKTGEEKTELVFAKVPDFVKSVSIPMVSGSLLYSPNPLTQGYYTIYISCNNGKVADRVAM